MNTNASFIIRDCNLIQESQHAAIKLVNTTAGRIEYTTIVGSPIVSPDSAAIKLLNANNTVVTYMHSDGNKDMGFHAQYSYHLTLTNSLFNSTDFRSARAEFSDYLTIDNCQFYQVSTSGYWCTRWNNVNHTVITNSEFYSDGGVSGISIDEAYYSSISDVYIWGSDQDGLNVDDSPNITITRATIEESQGDGAAFDNSPGFVFTDSTIFDTSTDGLDIATSPNSTISNINIATANSVGIRIDASANMSVTDIVTDETGSHGLYGQYSDFMTFDDITVTNALDTGIEFQFCNNGTLTNSVVQMTSDTGIYLWTCPNWTVTDNLVEYADGNGIHLHHGDNYLLTRNYVNYVTDTGINVDTSDNSNVIDNHVTKADSEGYVVTTCENITFAGNTADECWDGGSFDTSPNIVIEGNIFTNLIGRGMYINDMEDAIIRANVLSGAGLTGMDIDYLLTSTIEDNELSGFGFWFAPQRAYSYYNHTVVNNTVNGKDIYYGRDAVGVDLVASDYSQFIIINGSHVDIHDGTFDHVTNPVMLILSDNCTIWDIESFSNRQTCYVDRSDDTTMYDIYIDGGGFAEGIFVRASDHFNLTSSVIERCSGSSTSGVYLWASDDATITDCEFDLNHFGIYANDVNDFLVSDNLFTNHDSRAISVVSSSSYYVRILNNDIFNATYGVYFESGDNVTISMNTIMYTTNTGIRVSGGSSTDVNVTLNVVTNNADGIEMHNNGNSFAMNNTIMWNTGYGIYSDPSTPVEVYYNIIAFNLFDNGLDETTGNFWDDGVDTGNWWDDYTPPGVYAVDGNTDDRYPMQYAPTEPIINQPQDLYYAEGSEGNEITWLAFDDSLKDWAVTIDGGAWEADAWDFVDITVNIDGLAYGTHTVFVTLWDIHDNFVNDTVLVHVFDDTPPAISNVPNTVAFVGGSNQILSWEVSDLHSDTYTVFLDGDEYATGSWTTGLLEFNIDGLTEGEHSLIMQIADLDGNTAADQVLINVILDDVEPVIDSPDDITYEEGETGNIIVWNPQDDYPATFEISDESSVLSEGTWGGSRVVFNVDGLSVGSYRFQITVTDGSGNSVDDFVSVDVTAIVTEPPPPPPPIDLGFIGIVVVGIGAVAIVIVVIWIIRKKRPAY